MLTAVTPDALVPQSHPIRRIKPMVDSALAALSPTFSRMYASVGRPSIPPEHLLKGCLLMALFSVRSERQLCERLEYDMLQMVLSSGRITVGADRGHDTRDFVWGLPGHAHHTARGTETALGDRWTDHTAWRIQVESACAQTR